MRHNETVGILMDTNMTPPQGVFVDFFGIPACTASGLARVALHTGAAVVPASPSGTRCCANIAWSSTGRSSWCARGNDDADAVTNTARFNEDIEEYVRRYPDQWLWVHRRWKTRPPGQPPLY